MSNAVYKTKATSVGARSGTACLSDSATTFNFEKPKELGGENPDKGVNPEQLLASAYSACYGGAVIFVIEHDKLNAKLEKMECEVLLVKKEIGHKFEINLMAYLSGINASDAEKVLKKAHKVSPFSHAFGSNITIKTDFKLL